MLYMRLINTIMSRLVLLIICIFASIGCCNAGCSNDGDSLSCNEKPLFEYKGVIREMHSSFNVCDSLLSVYVENEVQNLASKGFEGKFFIRAKMLIGKNGKVKKIVVLDKRKDMDIIYSEVSYALRKVIFKPCIVNNSPKTTSIVTLLIIDTYHYPSNLSKILFESLN